MIEPPDDRITDLRVGQRTRLITLLALGMASASFLCSVGFVWALAHNADMLREAGVIPTFDSRFDAIAAAAAIGRLDIVSLILTLIGVIAAGLLIYGWTAFRSAAVEAAIREVRNQMPEALKGHMGSYGESLIANALRDAELLAHIQRRFTDVGIDDTEAADSVDTDANWKEE